MSAPRQLSEVSGNWTKATLILGLANFKSVCQKTLQYPSLIFCLQQAGDR